MKNDTTPRVYVGTYAKYNSGSIAGKWVELEEFAGDELGFIAACEELHSDEEDPEFMFQDYEGFPSEYYGESGLNSELFQWLELDDNEREQLSAFVECFGTCQDFDSTWTAAQDAYHGEWGTFGDFCYDYVNETTEIPDHLRGWIDWDRVERDLMHDYIEHEGHVFSRNW